eukprot:TRINITY_DN1771_c0_g1_i2.p2 TRINITY_DN1771_c0_g1~~TRINITY_DN1771_c0_g1_i2.p2  ORF type:complete len:457 (-),score=63.84 TRINITY_DN1771_c0_g1_i2:171-1541(-)
MIKAEELRVAFAKDVLQKYAKEVEQLAKSVLEGAQSALKSAEKVDPKQDVKKILEDNKKVPASRVFDFVKCEKYDIEYLLLLCTKQGNDGCDVINSVVQITINYQMSATLCKNCPDHPSIAIEYFCRTCGVFGCSECARAHTLHNKEHIPLKLKEASAKLIEDIQQLQDIAYTKAFDPETTKKLKLLNDFIENLRDLIHRLEQDMMTAVAQFKQRHVFEHRQNCCKFYLQAKSISSTLHNLKIIEAGENYAEACLKGKEEKQKHIDALKGIKNEIYFPFERLEGRIAELNTKFAGKFSEAVTAIGTINVVSPPNELKANIFTQSYRIGEKGEDEDEIINYLRGIDTKSCKEITAIGATYVVGKEFANMIKKCPNLAAVSLSIINTQRNIGGEGFEGIKAMLEAVDASLPVKSVTIRISFKKTAYTDRYEEFHSGNGGRYYKNSENAWQRLEDTHKK